MGLLTSKNGLLNSASLEAAKLGKIIYVSIEELCANEKNVYEMDDIDLLVENIQEMGLIEPLHAFKSGDGQYVLTSGHRRLQAIKKLIESGETVKYNGKALDDHEIPVILNYPEDELQERVMLLSSNAYRTMDKKERRQVILEAHRCYTIHCANGDKPEGREREWITAITGISDGTVKDVLAEINKKDVDGDLSISAEDIVEKEPEEDEFQKCIKKIQSLDKFLQKKSPDFREKDELTKQQLRISIDGLIDTLEILRG